MLVSLTIRCDWPGCNATLTVAYRAEIAQQHRWKAESDGDYSQHLCPAHKRKDWHEVAMAQFSDNLRKAHRTPGGPQGPSGRGSVRQPARTQGEMHPMVESDSSHK